MSFRSNDLVRETLHQERRLGKVALAGNLNAKMEAASLDEIIAQINAELVKLGPLLDLDAIREPQGMEDRLPVSGD